MVQESLAKRNLLITWSPKVKEIEPPVKVVDVAATLVRVLKISSVYFIDLLAFLHPL